MDNPHRGRDTLKVLWPADDSQQDRGPPVRREKSAGRDLYACDHKLSHAPSIACLEELTGQSVVTHSEHKISGE